MQEWINNTLKIFKKKQCSKQIDIICKDKKDFIIYIINIMKYHPFEKEYYIVSIKPPLNLNSDKDNIYIKACYSLNEISEYIFDNIKGTNYHFEIDNINELFGDDITLERIKNIYRNRNMKITELSTNTVKINSISRIGSEVLDIWGENKSNKIVLYFSTDIGTVSALIIYFFKIEECDGYFITVYLPLDDSLTVALDLEQGIDLINLKSKYIFEQMYQFSDDPRVKVDAELHKELNIEI